MKNLSIQQVTDACQGIYIGPKSMKDYCISSITTDSRNIEAGSLFVAIKGERVDGHDYISSAYEKKAACCLSEKELSSNIGPYILVNSSLQAIKDIAAYYRQSLDLKVVGITGSVGKTSTKEMVASVLEQGYQTLKTLGNFNNELGLPLTIFRLDQEHEAAVLEMGISDFNEMDRLSKIARPDVCVITNIGDCHLENLKNRDGVLKAKSEIFNHMASDGKVILNGDDEHLASIKEVRNITPIFFGIHNQCDVFADKIESHGLKGTDCIIHVQEEAIPVHIAIPGYHMVYNALAGAAIGNVFGLTKEQIKKGIEDLQPVAGRNHIIETSYLTIIDDCYNANPVSMKASIDVLKEAEGRKVAILGDMFELGQNQVKLHEQVGAYVAEKEIDLIICVGDMSKFMSGSAINRTERSVVLYVKTKAAFIQMIPQLLKREDTVLVKASHGMHFEEIVDVLKQM